MVISKGLSTEQETTHPLSYVTPPPQWVSAEQLYSWASPWQNLEECLQKVNSGQGGKLLCTVYGDIKW